MKLKFLLFALATMFSLGLISCSTSRGGCKATQGYVGYGH